MSFENKMDKLESGLQPVERTKATRVAKSYTLRPELAAALAERAAAEDLTASRYLERILKKEFNL